MKAVSKYRQMDNIGENKGTIIEAILLKLSLLYSIWAHIDILVSLEEPPDT